MTEPRTDAGRHFVDHWRIFMGDDATAEVVAIEAEAAAHARAEALTRFKAAHDGVCDCPGDGTDRDCYWPCIESARAILAGETD